MLSSFPQLSLSISSALVPNLTPLTIRLYFLRKETQPNGEMSKSAALATHAASGVS